VIKGYLFQPRTKKWSSLKIVNHVFKCSRNCSSVNIMLSLSFKGSAAARNIRMLASLTPGTKQ